MLSEVKKSLNYIIYERTTSPFWGSFIFSWIICNWKILVTLFVISEDKLSINKIDFISQNFIDWKPIALYPFISTFVLITLFPLLGNLAYWITIIYSKWRLDKRNEVEKKQLLSIEQSLAIRQSNRQIAESYSSLVNDKETEIRTLKLELEELQTRLAETSSNNNSSNNLINAEQQIWDDDYKTFKKSSPYKDFEMILRDINSTTSLNYYDTPTDSIIYFESIDLITNGASSSVKALTKKG